MKVTAETITDAQIREFEMDVLSFGTTAEKCDAVDLATWALLDPNEPADRRGMAVRQARMAARRLARAGIAAAWNARHGGGPASALTPEQVVKVTAETITDEQIRQLLDGLPRELSCDDQAIALSGIGSLEYETMCWTRDARAMRLRGECAAAWNARHGGG